MQCCISMYSSMIEHTKDVILHWGNRFAQVCTLSLLLVYIVMVNIL